MGHESAKRIVSMEIISISGFRVPAVGVEPNPLGGTFVHWHGQQNAFHSCIVVLHLQPRILPQCPHLICLLKTDKQLFRARSEVASHTHLTSFPVILFPGFAKHDNSKPSGGRWSHRTQHLHATSINATPYQAEMFEVACLTPFCGMSL